MPRNIAILCPACRNKAKITSSKIQNENLKSLYCKCLNQACKTGFVCYLEYSHTIKNIKELIIKKTAES